MVPSLDVCWCLTGMYFSPAAGGKGTRDVSSIDGPTLGLAVGIGTRLKKSDDEPRGSVYAASEASSNVSYVGNRRTM
jgi:hypothetical protein